MALKQLTKERTKIMKKAIVISLALILYGSACRFYTISTISALALVVYGTAVILRFRLGETYLSQIRAVFEKTTAKDVGFNKPEIEKKMFSALVVMFAFAATVEAAAFIYLKRTDCPQLFILFGLATLTLFLFKKGAQA